MEVNASSAGSGLGTGSGTAELECACGRSFTRVENLRRHQRTHGSIRLQCPTCSRHFTRPDVLKRHIRTHLESPDRPRDSIDKSSRSSIMAATPQLQVSNLRAIRFPDETCTENMSTAHVHSSRMPTGTDIGFRTSSPSVSPNQLVENDIMLSRPSPRLTEKNSDQQNTMEPSTSSHLASFNSSGYTAQINYSNSNAYTNVFPLDLQEHVAQTQPNSPNTLSWNDGMLWILQGQATPLDINWMDFTNVGNGMADSVDFDTSFLDSLTRPIQASAPSRPASPPNGTAEGDNWPTNYQPQRPYILGAEGRLEEVCLDPLLDPSLSQWERYWLTETTYDKVKSSLKLSQTMPGVHPGSFQMPTSLHTVNTLISIYFNSFYPQLPILHLPSFSMSEAPPLLVAGFMCIGAFLSRLQGSRPFAVDMVEIIRRTLAALFEMDSVNLRSADLIHVSLLACFAGLWSGHQRSFELAELSRGMLTNLCRKARLLETPIDVQQFYQTFTTSSAAERWHLWILAESKKRLGLAIFLLDSLFPCFFDTPSYLSQGEMLRTILPCDEQFWQATSAEEWVGLLGLAAIPPAPYFVPAVSGLLVPRYAHNPVPPVRFLNPFASLCIVTALHHHIWEFRSQLSVYHSLGVTVSLWQRGSDQPADISEGFEGRRVWLQDALNIWQKEYYDLGEPGPLSDSGRVLFHLGHIALRAHLRDLYAVAGKNGSQSSLLALPNLKHWASSSDSIIAAEHALSVLSVISFPKQSVNRYTPTSAFIAFLCLWAFVRFSGPQLNGDAFNASELVRMFGASGPQGLPSGRDILTRGTRYLAQCKEWRISAALALVLAKMIEQDEG